MVIRFGKGMQILYACGVFLRWVWPVHRVLSLIGVNPLVDLLSYSALELGKVVMLRSISRKRQGELQEKIHEECCISPDTESQARFLEVLLCCNDIYHRNPRKNPKVY